MNNPFGRQEGMAGRLDAGRAFARERAIQNGERAKEPIPAPSPRAIRQGDVLPGVGLRPEQTIKELKLDPQALLERTLKTADEFEQLRALAIELAKEHNNEKLETSARKTPAARLDMKSLQQEVKAFIATLGK